MNAMPRHTDARFTFAPTALRDLPYGERTIPALLERQARTHGDRPLVRCGAATFTVAQLRAAVAASAAGLAQAGVEPGDRVVLMASNRPELLELMLAAIWRGAIAVPVNTALRGEQLGHVLRTAAPRLIVVEDEVVPALSALDPGPEIARICVIGAAPATTSVGLECEPLPAPGAPMPAHPARFDEPATMFFTSGTTGPSKGVIGPHAQIHGFARRVVELLEIGSDDVLYNCLPLFHVNAWCCFFQALLSGARCVIGRRFSASGFLSEAVDCGATVTYLLGAMIPILLEQPPGPLDRAHRIRIVNGNAPPPEIAAAADKRFGFVVAENYASTETSSIFAAPLAELRPGWMGKPMDGFEVRVADEHDVEVPPGVAGELLIRPLEPSSIFSGYFAMTERTVEAWRNLWFHTGDRVVRDEDGWYRFLDRMADAIRRRGENISAFEVEHVLTSHPDVADVAVFAVPAEMGEDEIMAAVVPVSGRPFDCAALVDFCRSRLAYFAIPRYVELVDALPTTHNGKVRKHLLRERGVTAATVDLGAPRREAARSAR